MANRNLVGAVKSALNDVYNSNIPDWKKQQVMNKVNAMLNHGDYRSMTVNELEEIAKQRGILGYTGAKKEDLIEAIENGNKKIPFEKERPSYQRRREVSRLGREAYNQQYGNVGYSSRDRTNYNRVGQSSRDRMNYNRVGQSSSGRYKSRELVSSRGRVGCGSCSK